MPSLTQQEADALRNVGLSEESLETPAGRRSVMLTIAISKAIGGHETAALRRCLKKVRRPDPSR